MIKLRATEHFSSSRSVRADRDLYLDADEIASVDGIEIRTNDNGTWNHSGSCVSLKSGRDFIVIQSPEDVIALMAAHKEAERSGEE